MKAISHTLVDCYLKSEARIPESAWKLAGLVFIKVYRLILRPLSNKHCQFKISCSHYIEQLLRSNLSAMEVRELATNRVLDCSRPLSKIYRKDNINFVAPCTGNRYSANDVSIELLEKSQRDHIPDLQETQLHGEIK